MAAEVTAQDTEGAGACFAGESLLPCQLWPHVFQARVLCQAAEGRGAPSLRLRGGSPSLASAHSALQGPKGQLFPSVTRRISGPLYRKGAVNRKSLWPLEVQKGLEGGICWAHGCSPQFLVPMLSGAHTVPGCPHAWTQPSQPPTSETTWRVPAPPLGRPGWSLIQPV